MCLITVCPKGTDKNNDILYDYIRNGASLNSDGSGIMWKIKGSNIVNISKGYFNIELLIKKIKELNLTDDDELVIHHRTGTLGLISPENTHPFLITDTDKDAYLTEISIDKPAMVHNGIFRELNYFESFDRDMCDSFALARQVLSNIKDLNSKYIENAFKSIISFNKICILMPYSETIMLGNFIEEQGTGYFHSNNGYNTNYRDRGGYGYNVGYKYSNRFLNDGDDVGFNITNLNNYGTAGCGIVPLNSKVPENKSNYLKKEMFYGKIDGNIIDIYKKTINDFYFIKKSEYEQKGLESNKFEIDNIDGNEELIILRLKSENSARTESLVNIKNKYFMIPKTDEALNIYSDYLDLLQCTNTFSKNLCKKLNKLLEKAYRLTNNDKIMIKRFNRTFCKKAVSVYLDFLNTQNEPLKTSNVELIHD